MCCPACAHPCYMKCFVAKWSCCSCRLHYLTYSLCFPVGILSDLTYFQSKKHFCSVLSNVDITKCSLEWDNPWPSIKIKEWICGARTKSKPVWAETCYLWILFYAVMCSKGFPQEMVKQRKISAQILLHLVSWLMTIATGYIYDICNVKWYNFPLLWMCWGVSRSRFLGSLAPVMFVGGFWAVRSYSASKQSNGQCTHYALWLASRFCCISVWIFSCDKRAKTLRSFRRCQSSPKAIYCIYSRLSCGCLL